MLNKSFSIPVCGRERCRTGFWPQACWVSGAVPSSVIQTWSEMLSSRRWLHSTRRISSALGSMLTQNKQAACPEADKWMQRASPSSWQQGNPPWAQPQHNSPSEIHPFRQWGGGWSTSKEVSLWECNGLSWRHWRVEEVLVSLLQTDYYMMSSYLLTLLQKAMSASGPEAFCCLPSPDTFSGIHLCNVLLAETDYFCIKCFW